nr:unnamed protein product [Spirometra erinaceieuropaei]
MDPSDPDFVYLGVDRKALLKEVEVGSFDSKKVAWVEDEKEGFVLADIEETSGDNVTVRLKDGTPKTVKKDTLQQVNPPKFIMIEDMADLTYLNDASVLENLRARYYKNLIYTYSGLFCVTINPYKRFPIYSFEVALKYKGKRRAEMPPHIFSISDNAYHNMLADRENQSILITGESGAGKTENTKKVISYFAYVTAGVSKKEDAQVDKKGSLEDQIIQANPLLEAYGNAKTTRNNNSSRFGKFIRIHFGTTGKIAGADIEFYLLEKSRVTAQMKGERNFHIFYQLLSDYGKKYLDKLLVSPDPALYSFINQGELTIDGVDDAEEMKITDEAIDILGFTNDERMSLFKCTTSILNMGEMKFKQRPREEQAEADGTAEAEKVAFLLGVNAKDLLNSFLKPKVKVGNEYVTKGQNLDQVNYAVNALAKSLYSRLFTWLVMRVNKTLDTKVKRQYFIGVLDIAGFEIFDENGFEQICINYTNERLQQFFNHHMFVQEQEEYKKENIQWTFIDFGMDLQACIDLIEKPMGILSILEEECMFPKATDQTFKAKLYDNHLGKSPNFTKPRPPKPGHKEAHFELHHYAGSVPYNITGWLDKNKDPLNDTVVNLLQQSKEALVSLMFAAQEETGGKKKKSSSFMTVSYMHRESLNKLMKNLMSTSPHFIRCIVPNEFKQPGVIDAHLVLHQLHCNGVLEGIRICRKGFPNRMIYSEFKQRYSILAPNAIPAGFVDGKQVTEKILEACQMSQESYQCGTTKVFFKAGILAELEDMRDEKLSKIISFFQAQIRGYLMRKEYKKLQDQRTALSLIQRNIRKYLVLRTWPWWRLYTKVKPMLNIARQEEEMRKAAEELAKLKEEFEKMEKLKKELEEQNVTLLQQKNDIFLQLQTEQDSLADAEEKCSKLILQKADMESQIKELEDRLADEEDNVNGLEETKRKLAGEIDELKKDVEDLESSLQKAEQEKQTKDNQIRTLQGEMQQQEEQIGRLNKEKKALEEQNKRTTEALQAEEDKVNHLNKLKAKLEQTLDEMEENLAREQKIRADVEKSKRKLEGDLKATQEAVDDMERIQELEAESDAAKQKCSQLEKIKARLQGEIEDLMVDVERANGLASQLEKKQKNFDKTLGEWQAKYAESQAELENAQREARGFSTDVFRLKAQLEENGDQMEALRRENKNLSDEIHDLTEQLGEGGRSVHEADKARKRLEMEKEELQAALEEAEAALEQEEAKVQRAALELSQVRSEIDRRLAEKEEEFEATRKNHQRAIESMQASLEAETKGKAEAMRMKKKLEQDINEMEIGLDGANRARAELEKNVKKLQQEAREMQSMLEEEQRERDEMRENASAAERRANMLAGELEDVRNHLESAERARKSAEAERGEASDRASEMAAQVASLSALKRKMEADLAAMQADLEEAANEAKQADERAKKAMADSARVFEEVRQEQEHTQAVERARKQLEQQLKEMQVRLEESEANAMKGGKKALAKLEQRVRELESEVEAEQRRHGETQKNYRKVDRRLKEVALQAEEDKKNYDRMQELVDQLQGKIKTYKRQVEEAEEIAAVNLAKYRKIQHEVEDAEERADQAEQALQKLRAKNRSSVSVARGVSMTPGAAMNSNASRARKLMSSVAPEED